MTRAFNRLEWQLAGRYLRARRRESRVAFASTVMHAAAARGFTRAAGLARTLSPARLCASHTSPASALPWSPARFKGATIELESVGEDFDERLKDTLDAIRSDGRKVAVNSSPRSFSSPAGDCRVCGCACPSSSLLRVRQRQSTVSCITMR